MTSDAQQRPLAVVATVAGALLLLAGVLYTAAAELAPLPSTSGVEVPWWLLAALFSVAQAVVLNIEVRRQARSSSLTELPFVIGLLGAAPGAFVLARVVGGTATQMLIRRQYREPVKLAFNAAVVVAEAVIGLAVFRLCAVAAGAGSPWLWFAALVGAAVANAIGACAVTALIAKLEDELTLRHVLQVGVSALAHASVLATLGVVVSLTLDAGPWSVLPMLAACAIIALAYRAYARLAERHDSLERLLRFTQLVVSHPDTDRVVTDLLERVCDILHADEAVIAFFDTDDSQVASEAALRRGEPLERRNATYLSSDVAWIVDRVRDDEEAVLVQRGTRELAARHWLDRCGLREAIVTPLHGDNGVTAALIVTDRMGEARGFDADDVRLLATVANHTSVALRNGELVNRLRHDSMHDALTGLPNRASLERELGDRFEVLRGGGAPFALAMLDVDTFKEVNDTLGHHHGDTLLCEVAARMTVAIGSRGAVYRFGGDEFAILLPDCAAAATAEGLCLSVLRALTDPVEVAGTAIDLGASAGIALAPGHAETTADLIKRADLAMYAAKQAGRDVAVFEAAHDTSSPARLALVAALRHAVGEAAIDVYVQPKAALGTGVVTGCEALARWTGPEGAVVPPDQFIPLAERSGLILQLTDVVLERSIAACAAWQLDAPGVGIAVNLSARSLRDDKLDDQIARMLSRFGLPAEMLTLEITESSVMADPQSALGLLHRLRRRGVHLSIDDFGTGYSSLSYLRRLPVQEVKIDRSFVSGVDHDPENQAIVTSILQLAKSFDLTVVAEGVEEDAEWRLLQSLGCDTAQGYLLARPMPVAEFSGWFRSRGSEAPRLHIAR